MRFISRIAQLAGGLSIAELIRRVILLGGSALSPWAVQRDPLMVKRRVANQTGCPGDVEADDIAPCLRLKSVEELLAVQLDPPRFTSGFAPFTDGAVLPSTANQVIDRSICSARYRSTADERSNCARAHPPAFPRVALRARRALLFRF